MATLTGWVVLAQGLTGLQLFGAAVVLASLVAAQRPTTLTRPAQRREYAAIETPA